MPKDKKACQVAGCFNPLPTDRLYHTRYRICPLHAGMSELEIQGKDGKFRFCQQCGRFQPLSDFDGSKKSCINKLLMHNAQRKKAREKSQASKIKRKFSRSPTPGAAPEPQTPTAQSLHGANEIEDAIIGVQTPVKREAASPLFSDSNVQNSATAATALETSPVADMAAFDATPDEIDLLMESFINPLETQQLLSFLEEALEECQHSQQLSSSELLDPIITLESAHTTFPLNHPAQVSFHQQQFSVAATSLDNPLQTANNAVNFGARDDHVNDHNLDPASLATSYKLFLCHPSFLPLPILEHLKSLLQTAYA